MGRAQRKSTVHELCTAHSARRRKKKGGHTNPDVRAIIGASRSEPHTTEFYAFLGILGECRALWGERSEAWYRVTLAADAEAATYVKRVYVDYL